MWVNLYGFENLYPLPLVLTNGIEDKYFQASAALVFFIAFPNGLRNINREESEMSLKPKMERFFRPLTEGKGNGQGWISCSEMP